MRTAQTDARRSVGEVCCVPAAHGLALVRDVVVATERELDVSVKSVALVDRRRVIPLRHDRRRERHYHRLRATHHVSQSHIALPNQSHSSSSHTLIPVPPRPRVPRNYYRKKSRHRDWP